MTALSSDLLPSGDHVVTRTGVQTRAAGADRCAQERDRASEELDLERGLLRLRDSKTGPKIIPLGIAALELVAALKPNGSVYLFPDRRRPDQPIANMDWAWVCIRKKAALDDVRIHDLRHSFASARLASGEG